MLHGAFYRKRRILVLAWKVLPSSHPTAQFFGGFSVWSHRPSTRLVISSWFTNHLALRRLYLFVSTIYFLILGFGWDGLYGVHASAQIVLLLRIYTLQDWFFFMCVITFSDYARASQVFGLPAFPKSKQSGLGYHISIHLNWIFLSSCDFSQVSWGYLDL